MILTSVKSTGSWLHTGVCALSSSRDINIFHVSFHKVRCMIYVQYYQKSEKGLADVISIHSSQLA